MATAYSATRAECSKVKGDLASMIRAKASAMRSRRASSVGISRLAGTSARDVQADRLASARQLAERFQCIVVLKGSGTVIAAPGQPCAINSSGNALLATAGTGDVLAGMLGAGLAGGLEAFEAACGAVFAHGRIADEWPARRGGRALTASALASS